LQRANYKNTNKITKNNRTDTLNQKGNKHHRAAKKRTARYLFTDGFGYTCGNTVSSTPRGGSTWGGFFPQAETDTMLRSTMPVKRIFLKDTKMART
jgi:hypothetical protein